MAFGGDHRAGAVMRRTRRIALIAATAPGVVVTALGVAAALGIAMAAPAPAAPAHVREGVRLVATGASGRVTVGFGPDRADPSGDGVVTAADQVGALRGGGVLLGDSYRLGAKELDLVALRSDGLLQKDFGEGGLLQVRGLGLYSVMKIVGEADGGALVLAVNQNKVSGPNPLALVRVTAGGLLDGAFAGGGVDRLAGLSGPADVALEPDGGIVLASTVNASTNNPSVMITRLTSEGAPMPTFGSGGSVSLSPTEEQAVSVALAPDGDIVVLGNPAQLGGRLMLAALTQAGTLDPSFGGGAPVLTGAVSQSALSQSADQQLLIQPSGRIEALYSPTRIYFGQPAVSQELFVAAYTPTGAPDAGFGNAGTLELSLGEDAGLPSGEQPGIQGSLLAAPGEATLVLIPTASDAPRVVRLLPHGEPDSTFGGASGEVVDLGFGGDITGSGSITGGAGDFGETAAQREDGVILLAGTVELAYFNGGGSGFSNTFVTHDAIAALTPELHRDAAFGGRYPSLRIKARVVGVRGRSVLVRLRPSQAASVSAKVTAGGRLIARGSGILLYDEKRRLHAIHLTRSGGRRLRGGRRVRVRLTVTAAALDGQMRKFHASGRVG
jgi:uncharacterized delta-60 repeat protein